MILKWHLLSSSISVSKLRLWAWRHIFIFTWNVNVNPGAGATGPRTQVTDSAPMSVTQCQGANNRLWNYARKCFRKNIICIQIKCWLTVITVFNLLYNEIINYVMPAAPRHGRVRWAEVTFANIASSHWPAVSRDHSGELWLAADYNRQDAVSVAVPGSIASQRGFSSIHRENSKKNKTETEF